MSFKVNTARDLMNAILRIFSSLCKEFSTRTLTATEEAHRARCQDELERFFLWATAVSSKNGYLDGTLSRSSALRSSVLLILLELGNAVCKGLFKSITPNGDSAVKFDDQRREVVDLQRKAIESLQGDPQTAQFGGLDPYESETLETGLDDVVENITTFNDCLMDLSLALERPMTGFDKKHSEARVPTETFNVPQTALIYCRKIRERFPRLSVHLVERLGNANLQRANMLRDIKNLTQAADDGSRFVDSSLFSESISQVSDTNKFFSTDSKFSSGQKRRYHDTDFDTSSEATFAGFSTSVSVADQGRASVPPMPQQAEHGNTFTCEYCAKPVQASMTRQQWKSHVYEDIRPYVCTIHPCELSEALFSSIRSWARHQNQHAEQDSDGLNCPFCSASISSITGAFYRHVGRHLREVSLAVLPQTTSSESGEDQDSDESAESSPTPRRSITKLMGFEPTDIFRHRYQDPKVLKAYLKTLPDQFSDDDITVKYLQDGRLGLRLPRKLENAEIEGILDTFIRADRERQNDDED